jgi:hypothetical protein
MTSLQIIEAVLLEDGRRMKLTEITSEIGLAPDAFLELVNCELIAVSHAGSEYEISEDSYLKARRAARLAKAFELAPEGLALALRLLQRIEELESQFVGLPRMGRRA